jgi:hypothetical protein
LIGILLISIYTTTNHNHSRPSLPVKERLHFQAIYDRFRSTRKGDFKVAASSDDGTTLRTALK